MKKLKRSWIVDFWCDIFGALGHLSLFLVFKKLFGKLISAYHFVEIYVVINTTLSILILAIVTQRSQEATNLLLLAVVAFGTYRTFEIFIYQVNVLMFDEYRTKRKSPDSKYAVRSYRRTVLLLVHNYFEIICWFGVAYMWFYRGGHIILPAWRTEPTFIGVLHESLLLMFTFNPDQYSTNSDVGITIFSIQAIVGMFMAIIVLARFIGLLPTPETLDEFE